MPPTGSRGEYDTEFEHLVDVDLRDVLRAAHKALASIKHTVDAVDQPLQCGAVDLVGATEIVHHACFRPLGIGVPDAFGQGVVGDG